MTYLGPDNTPSQETNSDKVVVTAVDTMLNAFGEVNESLLAGGIQSMLIEDGAFDQENGTPSATEEP